MTAKKTTSQSLLPEEGTQAPDFCGLNQNGKEIKLSSFKGKKNVVLYFYPKDMTPGCTTEACDFKDQFKAFKNTVILGVSADSPERHLKFIAKYDLPFDLISDEDKTILNQYGVWQEKKLYGKTFMGIVRSTFIIDKKGILRKVFPKVKVKGHSDAVLESLKAL
ncbi:MAG: thioredoxin-dependent thiol peroxidase [Candidatus Nitrohelix vancouverensis]|uniref:thioredoxin-dependent peroxiredoxin n=1 Tax=Candidatus Nitrohelix vancouverensis TaxID=2705534 RepID=A0A7T0C4C4_9BACT|nr:MAG: thioredoxin-dependent thiol peroxidase [Candidatus Nitrohelix vancouverensis]